MRRFAAGDSRREQLLLGGVLHLHAEAGHPDQGARRRRRVHRLPQRRPLLRQGLRTLLPADREPARGALHPQLRHVEREDPETKNVTIRYATNDEGVKEEEFDMVVLSVGLNPPADVRGLAATFGIELNDHGFSRGEASNPMATSRAGIFASGAFQGPIGHPRIGLHRQRGGLPDRRTAGLPAGAAGRGARVPPREGRLGRRAEDRRLRLPLRGQHRQDRGGPFPRRVRPVAAQRRVRYRAALLVRHELGQGDHRHRRRVGAQPRRPRGLLAADARAAVPGHAARGRHQPVLPARWRTSANTSRGCTRRRRKRPPRRPRTSSACRLPACVTWSPCRSSTCPSTRRRSWSAAAWPA